VKLHLQSANISPYIKEKFLIKKNKKYKTEKYK